jgi:hypothetical protein
VERPAAPRVDIDDPRWWPDAPPPEPMPMEIVVAAQDPAGLDRLVEQLRPLPIAIERDADGRCIQRDGGYVLRAERQGHYAAWAIGNQGGKVLGKRVI